MPHHEIMRHRIALGLGKFLYEIDAMPASEFVSWCRYYDNEPFGAERDNLHAALICTTLTKKTSLDDFMFKVKSHSSEEDKARQLLGKLDILAAMAKE